MLTSPITAFINNTKSVTCPFSGEVMHKPLTGGRSAREREEFTRIPMRTSIKKLLFIVHEFEALRK